MNQHEITHLLFVSGTPAAPNRLISVLRNEGLVLHTACAGNAADLAPLLAQESWDLLVCFDDAKLNIEQILALLRKHELELPVFLVCDEAVAHAVPAQFRQDLREVLLRGDDARLRLGVLREAELARLKRRFRQLEMAQHELEQRHQALLSQSATPVSYVQEGIHLYCNQSYAAAFGHEEPASILATPLLNLVMPVDRPRLKYLLAQGLTEACAETLLIRKLDGSEEPMALRFSPVEYQGRPCLQLVLQPALGNPAFATTVARLETQDLLTRLDRSSHFLARIENAIGKAVRHGESSTLLVVEVNEFVDISSAIGRSQANMVLNDIADFLRQVIRKPYAAARLQEQRFGLLLYDGDPDAALAMANEIRARINNHISPAMLTSLELSCSVGIALINKHALNAPAVLERALNNLRANPLTAAPVTHYHIGETLQHSVSDMLGYMKNALEHGRFKLQFQPLVPIKGGNHKAYEVLTRMLDNDGNEIAPSAFLPLANLNGMGESLDTLVVSLVLEALPAQGSVQRLILNVTSNTLMGVTFLPWLSEQLRARRIPADLLVLQISEIDFHNNPTQVLAFCTGLAELNVQVCLSHFGCALEPFTVFDKVGPEFVKLDESMVRDIKYSVQQKLHVQELVDRLHERELLVIAPQVDDMDVLPVLWETGVDYVQGYCLQRPSDEMNYEFVHVEEITLSAVQS